MTFQTQDSRTAQSQPVIKVRRSFESKAPQVQPEPSKREALGGQPHWMDRIALWVWVFGIGSLALINLIDLVKSLFVR